MKTILTRISTFKYQLLLLLAAAIWGLGTVLIKTTIDEFPPFWLVGTRFFTAGILFCIVFAPQLVKVAREGRLIEHVKVSAILGAAMIAGYGSNTLGLTDTTAAKSSFLTGLYCVLVPFIAWVIMRKKPTAYNLVAAVLCLAGVGFVSLAGQQSLAISWGDAVTLLSALLLGVHVAATSKLAPGKNLMVITGLQFVFGGAAALIVSGFMEAPPDMALFADPEVLVSVGYLILFATCAALLLQNVGLAKVPPSSGALLLSFESVFGVLFSIIVIHETVTAPMIFGFCLIFLAVIVSEWLPSSKFAVLARQRRVLRRRARRMRRPLRRRTKAGDTAA